MNGDESVTISSINFECQDITTQTTSSSTTTTDDNCQQGIDTEDLLIGLLTVLLTLAITGWVCTCVILKKKGTVNINETKTG